MATPEQHRDWLVTRSRRRHAYRHQRRKLVRHNRGLEIARRRRKLSPPLVQPVGRNALGARELRDRQATPAPCVEGSPRVRFPPTLCRHVESSLGGRISAARYTVTTALAGRLR